MNRLVAGEIVDMRNFTPPYEHQEYPKWVKLADGSQIVVNNEEEEQAALGEETSVEAGYENLLDALRSEAKALGLNPHHRAGADKIREMIDKAKS